ncbi:alpha-D-ribose 1-methylphosphonate 5-triphosphate diphosphatase [Aliiruegeria sabulilitoris]|uniref:alpha-D-ribose 1-methylphosphonate 5-triphosphate diphosphatase n=1 Tax=Aliiruegeria sabulilitoris TaxID=1510458 RepID=UPI000834D37E|nr:alpha-D-ribose 1-methylphosphonate 5-triphosphate diphosphatase [Aliiruegeria sabulilitoris]NDR58075.1 alpha-D-ribose 1-methylphosphonate 5-triphosphate diphosphatase [Pseudoruegeria sp. M32A2M]
MQAALPPVRFTGAQILRDGELQRRSLAVADGRITKGPLPAVDMRGYLLLPGIIDLHGDALERHIAPRPNACFDPSIGLGSVDRDAGVNGVTTAWLAVSWSWEGGFRGPDSAERILEALSAYRPHMGTDLHVQLRCETHMIDSAERMLAAIRRHGVDYVVFNNHLDEALEQARSRPEEFAHRARREGRTPEQHMVVVEEMLSRRHQVPRHLCRLAEAFDMLGLCYGSHGDPDGETRETFSMIGASIAEFPTTRPAAAAAKATNDPVILGAPNVLHGGSQSGEMRATDLVSQRLCDALASDYYYPALARAAWTLVDRGICDLPRAWAMISAGPAEILRLYDRGNLDFGRRADMIAVNEETRAIEMTISGGVLTYLGHGAARRFAAGPRQLAMAAE